MQPVERELIDRLTVALTEGDEAAVARITATADTEDETRRARLRAPDALAKAATWYATAGIAIFPLRPGEKRPATAHGLDDATTDPRQVLAWWRANPQANIGLRTGLRFEVLDVDPPHGWASLAEMRAAGLVPPHIGYALTPRGGAHIYLPPTGAGNAAGALPGIDWRGAGGYVVGAPSRTEAGMWAWSTPLELP